MKKKSFELNHSKNSVRDDQKGRDLLEMLASWISGKDVI